MGQARSLPQPVLFAALEAWIDLHIADPRLHLTLDDWDEYWDQAQENDWTARGVLANFQSALRQQRARRRGPGLSRLDRQLAQVQVSAVVGQQFRARLGQAMVEEVCGWTEERRAYGKRVELFHPGAAGLTPLECRVLELSQRFQDERGRPDFVRIADLVHSTRASSLQTLTRARRKVREYWDRLGKEE